METIPALLYLQQPATWSYPEPDEPNLCPPIAFY